MKERLRRRKEWLRATAERSRLVYAMKNPCEELRAEKKKVDYDSEEVKNYGSCEELEVCKRDLGAIGGRYVYFRIMGSQWVWFRKDGRVFALGSLGVVRQKLVITQA